MKHSEWHQINSDSWGNKIRLSITDDKISVFVDCKDRESGEPIVSDQPYIHDARIEDDKVHARLMAFYVTKSAIPSNSCIAFINGRADYLRFESIDGEGDVYRYVPTSQREELLGRFKRTH